MMIRGLNVFKRIASALSVVGIVLGAAVFAAPAANAHNIVCQFTAYKPYKTGFNVGTSGAVSCNYSPDISVSSLRIWRRNTDGTYTMVGERSYSDTLTERYYSYVVGCSSSLNRQFHTQLYNESFHENWGTTNTNSVAVWLNC